MGDGARRPGDVVSGAGRADSERPRRRGLLFASAAVLFCIGVALLLVREFDDEGRVWRMRELLGALAAWWAAGLLAAAATSRKALLRAAAASIGAALALGLLEILGLAGLVDYRRRFGNEEGDILGSHRLPNADITGTTWEDTAWPWGLPSSPIRFHYRTDRRGFRNARDRDAADVYLLGDSFVVAALLPFEETLCAKLEAATGRPVMNISLIGLAVQQARDIFREAQVPLDSRLVLQFVCEDNDQEDSAEYRGVVALPLGETGRPRTSFSYNALRTLQQSFRPPSRLAGRRTGTISGELYAFKHGDEFRGHEAEIPHIVAALDDTRRLVESGAGRYGVVVIPKKIRVLGALVTWPPNSELRDHASLVTPLPAAVAAWGAREGVPVLDLTEPLRRSAEAGRIPWMTGDSHWNSVGHDVTRDAIDAWIDGESRLQPRPPRER